MYRVLLFFMLLEIILKYVVPVTSRPGLGGIMNARMMGPEREPLVEE